MPQLDHSKIYRGGVTARTLHPEPGVSRVVADQRQCTLDIRFNLASKGGGTTSILLKIGKEDFLTILQEMATKLPESVGVLVDCASIATKRNLALLDDARKAHASEKAHTKSVIENLRTVQQLVSKGTAEARPQAVLLLLKTIMSL